MTDLNETDLNAAGRNIGFKGTIPDHIMLLTSDEPFTLVDLEALFGPQYTHWQLYHAMRTLEQRGRIHYAFSNGKRKYYVKETDTKMPRFKDRSGSSAPVAGFLPIDQIFDSSIKTPQTLSGQTISFLPVLISNIFRLTLSAQHMEPEEFALAFNDIRKEILLIRSTATRVADWMDTLIGHPSMAGNQKDFIRAYTKDKAYPPASRINDSVVWASDNWRNPEEPKEEKPDVI